MRIYALYLTSVSCGFCMMSLEILGPRYLSPRFGSSVDVWAAIISVFILSLSIGYWLGGRIADKARTNNPLGWIILAASAFFLLLPAYTHGLVEGLGKDVHTARWGSLLAGALLFLPPSLLLGCVSPMLVKLVFIGADQVGRTTGTLYAISAFGNVVGILATDYILLEAFHLNTSTIAMGVVLAITGVLHILITLQADRNGTTTLPAVANENGGETAAEAS
ncbi:MAG: fused MFS/spermidine synthase [Planctomycetota bacterium]|nr:fused MFS/spermidine synthase [Planctomycetota bacterium]